MSTEFKTDKICIVLKWNFLWDGSENSDVPGKVNGHRRRRSFPTRAICLLRKMFLYISFPSSPSYGLTVRGNPRPLLQSFSISYDRTPHVCRQQLTLPQVTASTSSFHRLRGLPGFRLPSNWAFCLSRFPLNRSDFRGSVLQYFCVGDHVVNMTLNL